MTIVGRAGNAMRNTHKHLDPHQVEVFRGGSSFCAIATIGQTQTDEVLNDNTVITTRLRNFFIDVSDYDFGSGAVEPAIGDEIHDQGAVFVVCKDMTDSHWRWSDRERTYYRINTVERSR
jgi:hypothetical protein